MSAAPVADEVETLARAMWFDDWPYTSWDDAAIDHKEPWRQRAAAALAALAPLRQAERERAWLAGAEAMRAAVNLLAADYIAHWHRLDGKAQVGALMAFSNGLRTLPPSQGDAP